MKSGIPGQAEPQAMNVMRKTCRYQRYSREIDETIQNIALRHHDKNWTAPGIRFGLTASELTVGERIVAVAEHVSALMVASCADAFPAERVLSIVSEQKDLGKIDSNIVDILIKNYDEIMASTCLVQAPVLDKYENIQKDFQKLL